MSSSLRPRGPRRQRRVRIRTGVIVASGVVALVGSLVLSRADTMEWFGLGESEQASADAGLRMLEAAGESPAERVVTELAAWAKAPGWKSGKPKASVSDPFGLTCLDGPVAWSTARARALSGDSGEGRVAVMAYPAGGGGAAYAQVVDAARRCADTHEDAGLGVESLAYRRGTSAVQVVRRGDVLTVVSSAPASALPGEGWMTELDDRLTRLLGDSCRSVDAPAGDARRNPFIDPEAFTGNVVMDPVPFPDVDLTRADDVATDPVVPLDSVPPTLPAAPERPAPLDPVAKDLPDLPLEVATPEAPQPPAAPDLDGRAARAVADPDGPGCGWAFNEEAVPAFDEATSAKAATQAVQAESDRLVDDAVAYEQGKVNFYRAWSDHLAAVGEYEKYVTELSAVVEQWQVVVDARAEFVAAFEKYRASRTKYDEFVAAQAEAQTAFDENLFACLDITNWGDPEVVCPAPRPAILSQTAPSVLPRPEPSPLAQLPQGWEPPAPAAPSDAADEGEDGADEGASPRRGRDTTREDD